MRKKINGKFYDTDRSDLLCASRTFYLYRTKEGDFFTVHSGDTITPLSYEAGKHNCFQLATHEINEAFFGAEDDKLSTLIPLKLSLREIYFNYAKEAAKQKHIKVDQYINSLIVADMRRALDGLHE